MIYTVFIMSVMRHFILFDSSEVSQIWPTSIYFVLSETYDTRAHRVEHVWLNVLNEILRNYLDIRLLRNTRFL
jgi:hypothetical protein